MLVFVLTNIRTSYFLFQFISLVLLNLKLQPVSNKIQGKQNFLDCRVFNLGYWGKSKTRKSRKFLFFLLSHIASFQVFTQLEFLRRFQILSYNYCQYLKEETYF